MDEHERPGQVLAPLDVPDRHLHEKEPEHPAREKKIAARLPPVPQQRGDDADERDREDPCRAHVYVQRVREEPVALDLLPAGVRTGRRDERAGDDERERARQEYDGEPVGREGGGGRGRGGSTRASQFATTAGCFPTPRTRSCAPNATTTATPSATSESRKCAITM